MRLPSQKISGILLELKHLANQEKLCIWRLIVFAKNAYRLQLMLSSVTPAPLYLAFLFSPKP
jgi:hypothetical protein